MAQLSFDEATVDTAAAVITRCAQAMPDPPQGDDVDAGAGAVDDAVATAMRALGNVILGAAAEMYQLGSAASAAGRVYAEADRAAAGVM